MGKITIEQALIATRPAGMGNRAFVDKVMQSINPQQPTATTNWNLFMKLRHLPKLAIIAAALVGLLLISGTAYAAYQLWFKPSVTVQTMQENQYGRTEVIATFENCKTPDTTKYEVKSGNTFSAEEVSQILQAHCEIDAITKWAASVQGPHDPKILSMVYPGAFKVTKIEGNLVSLHSESDAEVTITDTTKYIVNGAQGVMKDLKVGDVVTTVSRNGYGSGGGFPTKRDLLAIIKLDLPIAAYSPRTQNKIAERTPCAGNPAESCVNSGSIDVYPRNGESNSAPTDPGERFEIQGKLTGCSGTSFTLIASSGATYKVTAPIDVVAKFNTVYSQNYSNNTIEIGDMLSVRYVQKANDDHTVIGARQLQSVVLLIEVSSKLNPLNKY